MDTPWASAVAPGRCVTLVHLVWAPLGLDSVRRFVEAYRQHATGCAHRLLVVFNGFARAADTAGARAVLAAVAHEPLVLPAPVQDLTAYFTAAAHAESEYVAFLNSYATPLVDGWLDLLMQQAVRPGVGLVGATGSWESHYTNTVRHLGPGEPRPRTLRPRTLAGWTLRHAARVRRTLIARREYAGFPNAHLRSNAFLLRRDLMLSLRAARLVSKHDAERFESGRAGLTRRVIGRGLRVLVAGRDGRGYEPGHWPASRVFRSGDQDNLLVADNRTASYAQADPDVRRQLAAGAWGDPAWADHRAEACVQTPVQVAVQAFVRSH